jgi:REP element-mobilizing transposase RayT
MQANGWHGQAYSHARALPIYNVLVRYESGLVRKLRHTHNLTGHAHELTFSCHRRLPLLNRDRTREWFIEALKKARARLRFQIWAYVIMPEHAHVLIFPETDEYSVATILKAIKQPVSQKACAYLRKHAPQWLEKLRVTWPSGRVPPQRARASEFRFAIPAQRHGHRITAAHATQSMHPPAWAITVRRRIDRCRRSRQS